TSFVADHRAGATGRAYPGFMPYSCHKESAVMPQRERALRSARYALRLATRYDSYCSEGVGIGSASMTSMNGIRSPLTASFTDFAPYLPVTRSQPSGARPSGSCPDSATLIGRASAAQQLTIMRVRYHEPSGPAVRKPLICTRRSPMDLPSSNTAREA